MYLYAAVIIRTENHRYLSLKYGLWLPWVSVKARRKSHSKWSFLLPINSRITWEMMGDDEKHGSLSANLLYPHHYSKYFCGHKNQVELLILTSNQDYVGLLS